MGSPLRLRRRGGGIADLPPDWEVRTGEVARAVEVLADRMEDVGRAAERRGVEWGGEGAVPRAPRDGGAGTTAAAMRSSCAALEDLSVVVGRANDAIREAEAEGGAVGATVAGAEAAPRRGSPPRPSAGESDVSDAPSGSPDRRLADAEPLEVVSVPGAKLLRAEERPRGGEGSGREAEGRTRREAGETAKARIQSEAEELAERETEKTTRREAEKEREKNAEKKSDEGEHFRALLFGTRVIRG